MVSSPDGIVEVFLRNIPYPAMLFANNGTIMAANQRLYDFFGLYVASVASACPPVLASYKQLAPFFKYPAEFEQGVVGLFGQTEQQVSAQIETVDGRFITKDSSHFIVNGQNLGLLLVFRDAGSAPSQLGTCLLYTSDAADE